MAGELCVEAALRVRAARLATLGTHYHLDLRVWDGRVVTAPCVKTRAVWMHRCMQRHMQRRTHAVL
eukprot:239597-Chlamydomonas_euryale.AAC.1